MRTLTNVKVAGKDGLKGRRMSYTLDRADLFVGPNGAGKTTCLVAVMAGLRGLSDAPLDLKKGADAREFIGARPAAEVTLTWNDASMTRDLAVSRGRGVDAPNMEADRIAGPHVVRFDLTDFAMASDAVRAKLLEQACAAGATTDAAGLVPDLCVTLELAEPTKPTGDAGLFGGATLAPSVHPFYDLLLAYPTKGVPPSKWLASALAWTAETFTEVSGAAKRATAAVTEHEEAARAAEQPAGTLREAERHLASLRDELLQVEKGLASHAALAKGRKDRAGEGERLVEAVGRAAAALEEAEKVLVVARAVTVQDEEGLLAALRVIEAQREEIKTRGAAAAMEATELEAKFAAATKAWMNASGILATLEDLAGDPNVSSGCRHCQGPDPLGLADRVTLAEIEWKQREADVEDATADLTIAKAMLNNIRAEFKVTEDPYAKASRAETMAATANVGREDEIVDRLRTVDLATRVKTSAEQAFTAWQAREEEVAAGTGDGGDLDTLAVRLDALTAEIIDGDADVKAHTRYAERTKNTQDSIAKREAASARVEQVKAVKVALLALQATLAGGAYKPIQDAANELLERACVKERVVIESESDFGAMVMNPDRSRLVYVPFWSLSGSERALVGVSMAYAFARLSRSPWTAVILDAMEVLDRARLPGVALALTQMAHEGKIGNVIMAMHEVEQEKALTIAGLTNHWVGR